VFLLDKQGVQHSTPFGWTNAAQPELFVEMSGGRSAFRVSDLLERAILMEQLSGLVSSQRSMRS
jgi:hypothetical protein